MDQIVSYKQRDHLYVDIKLSEAFDKIQRYDRIISTTINIEHFSDMLKSVNERRNTNFFFTSFYNDKNNLTICIS